MTPRIVYSRPIRMPFFLLHSISAKLEGSSYCKGPSFVAWKHTLGTRSNLYYTTPRTTVFLEIELVISSSYKVDSSIIYSRDAATDRTPAYWSLLQLQDPFRLSFFLKCWNEFRYSHQKHESIMQSGLLSRAPQITIMHSSIATLAYPH